MDFARLARELDRVRATSGRLETIRILAEVFRDFRADADAISYLLQGRLGPPYSSPDMGFDDKRLAEAVSHASGLPLSTIWGRFQAVGDMGAVAAEFIPVSPEPVPVRVVFDDLRRIAEISGPGSTPVRIDQFSNLLKRVGRVGAAALIGIASGKLRLGVGDVTVVEALSRACVGDSTLRLAIERAYSLSSDLGLVASVALQRGEAGLAAIHPTVGRPVLSALAERLPSPEEVVRRLGSIVAEPKYDGVRLQAQVSGETVWLFTRRLENVTDAFPDVVRGVREQVDAGEAILDGEVIGYVPETGRFLPLQETVRRRRVHGVEAAAESIPILYFAFDLMMADGVDLTREQFETRRRRLVRVVRDRPDGIVKIAPETAIRSAAELEAFAADMVARGLEGTVVKRLDAPYDAGARTFNWVKLKPEYAPSVADTVDVAIVGYFYGKGRRARLGIGAILVAIYDLNADCFRTVSRVGSGLTDPQWTELKALLDKDKTPGRPPRVDSVIVPDVWVEPRYVVEILSASVSRSPVHTAGKAGTAPGYALRFPRVTRLRPDRRAEDVTTESEITAIFGKRP